MKKKWILIPLIIFITIITIIFLRGQYKMTKQNKLDQYLISQKPRIEKYLKYNYENIGDIKLEKVEETPMGGIYINGVFIDLSNNKEITFVAKVEPNTGVEKVGSFPVDFHDKNLKKELKGKTKSVSEIEKIERNSLSFNEKMELLQKKNNTKKNNLSI